MRGSPETKLPEKSLLGTLLRHCTSSEVVLLSSAAPLDDTAPCHLPDLDLAEPLLSSPLVVIPPLLLLDLLLLTFLGTLFATLAPRPYVLAAPVVLRGPVTTEGAIKTRRPAPLLILSLQWKSYLRRGTRFKTGM